MSDRSLPPSPILQSAYHSDSLPQSTSIPRKQPNQTIHSQAPSTMNYTPYSHSHSNSPPPAFTSHRSNSMPMQQIPMVQNQQHQQQVPQQPALNPHNMQMQQPLNSPGYQQGYQQGVNGQPMQMRLLSPSLPIPLLMRYPASIDCPACGQRGLTNCNYEVGRGTHTIALVFFLTTGLGVFIPYLANHFKDVQHKCGKCGVVLATCHYSSGTEAHLH